VTRLLASFPSPPQGVWHIHIPLLDLLLPIRAYALCIIVGIIVALIIGDRRWVARGGEKGVIYDIALWAVPFGLVGGRLYHVMTDWTTYFGKDGKGFIGALQIWEGGLGIWGAVALGGVIAPGIVLAQAIGRVGNYFNQELYDGPTSLPWGLEIYERRDAAGNIGLMDGVSTGQLYLPHPVHPTFLYELLWNVLVFVVLIYVDRRFTMGHGRLFALYVAAYCVGRFWVERLRVDPASMPIDGIRVNSLTSTFVFIGAVVYIVLAPKGREDPKTLAGKPREPTVEEAEPEEPKGAQEELKGKDSELVEWTKELIGAASTSGVVAGVAVAAKEDDEESTDADEEAKDEAPDADSEPDAESETPEEVVDADAVAEPEEQPVAEVAEAKDEAPEADSEPDAAESEMPDDVAEQPTASDEPDAEVAQEPESDEGAQVDEAEESAPEPEAEPPAETTEQSEVPQPDDSEDEVDPTSGAVAAEPEPPRRRRFPRLRGRFR
jgi:prolipoprotein diacylglyceryltransferase